MDSGLVAWGTATAMTRLAVMDEQGRVLGPDVEIDMRVHAVFTQYDGFVLPQFEPDTA